MSLLHGNGARAGILFGLLGLAAGFLLSTSVLNVAHAGQESHGGGGGAHKTENWSPVDQMHLYLCAFHIAKGNPEFQIEAHHYCSPCGKDLHQCVIYDRSGPAPKLLGIEYIIPDDVYRTLPADEKKYWHPHAYEIVSGQLVAPELPKDGDEALSGLVLTWGKTWHTWRDPNSALPLGEPLLMWSANGDGQIRSDLLDGRDKRFGISTAAIRERRRSCGLDVPQIPPPKSLDEVGRRWTATGPDEPTRTRPPAGS